MAFAARIVSPFFSAIAMLYPFGLQEPVSRSVRASRWLLHLALWSGVFALLWYFERSLFLTQWLRSPIPAVHRYYLVIVAVAVYSLGWLARGLWNALRVENRSKADDDLAEIWADAMATIDQAGICTAKTPMFLIVGPPSTTMNQILEQWGLRGTSPKTNLPFHVSANHDAIIVATDRLSVLGSTKSRRGRLGDDSSDYVVGAVSSQLAALCSLIAARSDRPALQGVLMVLPWESTNGEISTRATIEACQTDLLTIRHTLGLDMPIFFKILGASRSQDSAETGVAAFQAFPPAPDLDPANIPGMWKDGIDRLCLETLPMQRLAQANADSVQSGQEAYDLVSELHARRRRWVQLIAEGTRHADGEPGMAAGICVITNNPDDALTQQAAKSLWTDMLEYTPISEWSPQAIARAEAERRLVRWRFGLGLAAVIAALAGSTWYLFGHS